MRRDSDEDSKACVRLLNQEEGVDGDLPWYGFRHRCAVVDALVNLIRGETDADVKEVAADKGYHSSQQITDCTATGLTTYVPQPTLPYDQKWTNKPDEMNRAVFNNRRRKPHAKERRLQLRSCV